MVYLCSGKAGELKGRIAFDFLNSLKTEYERGGYEDKQNISQFSRFVDSEMVRRYREGAFVSASADRSVVSNATLIPLKLIRSASCKARLRR